MKNSRMKKENDEVYVSSEPITKVAARDISDLKSAALSNVRKRARLCTHRDNDAAIHEMLIVHTRDTYVRPHKHVNKIESFQILEGTAELLLFDEQGSLTGCTQMANYSSGLVFYQRLSEPIYHALRITSNIIVFHEVTSGPFNRSDTLFSPWSPDGSDRKAVEDFRRQLAQQTEKFMQQCAKGY